MDIKRIWRHLTMTHGRVNRDFPPAALLAIEQAIKKTESAHSGEVRFVVEGALDGAPLFHAQSARERAHHLFAVLRIWDTEHNNGVLIYVLLADRAVEVVADRGIHAKAGPRAWLAICHEMEAAFRAGNFEHGAVRGVQAVARRLVDHFACTAPHSGNELPNTPLVL